MPTKPPDQTLAAGPLRWLIGGFLGGAGLVGLIWAMLAQTPPTPTTTAADRDEPASAPAPAPAPVLVAAPPPAPAAAITQPPLAAVATNPEPPIQPQSQPQAQPQPQPVAAAPSTAPTPPPQPAAGLTVRINVNTADAGLLDSLPRIGPALAARIIEYRNANGPFASLQDLVKVKGIGEKTVEELAPYVTFD